MEEKSQPFRPQSPFTPRALRQLLSLYEDERFVPPQHEVSLLFFEGKGLVTLKISPAFGRYRAVLTKVGCRYLGLTPDGKRIQKFSPTL